MAADRITIRSEEEFLELIAKDDSKYIPTVIGHVKRGTGVALTNIDFANYPDYEVLFGEKDKYKLISGKVFEALSKVAFPIFISNKIKFVELTNCTFDDSLQIFSADASVDFSLSFNHCTFLNKVNVTEHLLENLSFSNSCVFNDDVVFTNTNKIQTFSNCIFRKKIIAEDAVFDNKVRFRACHFKGNVNFYNTTFKELADFWRCTFYQRTTFYKTDFMDIVVFSAAIFKEDVSFTYALINKLLILRGTKPKQGFDLSLAIVAGNLSVFDFKLKDFEAVDVFKKTIEKLKENPTKDFETVYEDIYEHAVSENDGIPLINKRETFRILKDQLESQRSVSESLPYKLLEKETLRKELVSKLVKVNKVETKKERWKKFWKNASVRLDQFNLWLNRWSSNHGTSYGRAFLFIVLMGGVFFYCSLIATKEFSFELNPLNWSYEAGIKYYVQFLIPTHKFNYMGIQENSWFYIWDFLGRTFVGYGIYQFIQAFRKYR